MGSRKANLSRRNLFEELIAMRDLQRQQKANAVLIVDGDDLPIENNRHGLMQWYLHPKLEDVAIRSQLIYVQHIPPRSKSGRQHHPGGKMFYMWEGKGHTVIDGVSYPWAAGDLVQLPLRPNGVVYQHFNDSDEETVKIVAVEANFYEALGVDKGSVFEELENSPDYQKQ